MAADYMQVINPPKTIVHGFVNFGKKLRQAICPKLCSYVAMCILNTFKC